MPRFKKFKDKSKLDKEDILALANVYGCSDKQIHNVLAGHREDKKGIYSGAELRLKEKMKKQKQLAKKASKL